MERVDREALVRFVDFAFAHDMQIVVDRREGRRLLVHAITSAPEDGAFEYPAEKVEKILSFLSQDFSNRVENVTVYSFIRLLGELRRELRANHAGEG